MQATIVVQTDFNLQQQQAFVGDRHPVAWAMWLTNHSIDPNHSERALFAFLHANRGLHPEYAAYAWLYSLRSISQSIKPTLAARTDDRCRSKC
jgi:hypothetical protein